ncbi:hypothetical protein [Streptomyces anulatus]|uniref:hypothetical protein n=1 Tax=Streptomyces anulatus TaxID=1892 RepID=UPI00366225CB
MAGAAAYERRSSATGPGASCFSTNLKPTKLANGTGVQVADDLKANERVDVDPRDGSFKERSKK